MSFIKYTYDKRPSQSEKYKELEKKFNDAYTEPRNRWMVSLENYVRFHIKEVMYIRTVGEDECGDIEYPCADYPYVCVIGMSNGNELLINDIVGYDIHLLLDEWYQCGCTMYELVDNDTRDDTIHVGF